ncbi:tRNA-splicing endonuclease subunit Sen54 isoform X2 [Antennarius striatus]|uniref:tRNA-splicing endonuclease subunit Sen54 isoform X2 n=1 Tax=Antennarius striatus TaxID=241820 RepID=UPI0035B41A77
MAEPDNTDVQDEFFNEVLSPSELFEARSRSHKIPVRGQKEFFPDGSEEQRQRVEESLKEHWSLVSEERVERQGNLVKATWIPSEQIVELQSPAGKFWQTMGFSADGKQRLLPEEALYLMECGNLQVFYQELPLSIQDGYENFLSGGGVSLQQYQVFGHLKRLGYVVRRFDPSLEPTPYERQLNLPPSRDRAGGGLKRKRSASPPTPPSSRAEGGGGATADRTEEEGRCEDEEGERPPELHPGSSSEAPPAAGGAGGGRSWWTPDVPVSQSVHRASPRVRSWNFNTTPFPDVGCRTPASARLPRPDPALLPRGVVVGVCLVARWRGSVNQRQVGLSKKEWNKMKRCPLKGLKNNQEVWKCRSWAEYRAVMARRRKKARPAHLWNRIVTPLYDPSQPLPTGETRWDPGPGGVQFQAGPGSWMPLTSVCVPGELLEKISVVKPTHLLEGATSIQASDEWRICFDVYQPDSVSDFKKSNPGKPYTRMCVCSFDGPVPDLRAMKQLTHRSGDVPLAFAVVDRGDVSFYTFKEFQLPRDVFPPPDGTGTAKDYGSDGV